MYDLTKELVAEEHRKDLHREAEKYFILHQYPSRLLKSRGIYQIGLRYLGQLLSYLGQRLLIRYGVSDKQPVSY